ncbi:DUF6984 family protein [Allorhizobium undicola]|uniref:DUF6984 family protein n=1 Tax=Allorhizobium undicola TaxID=78527 RepID=UPI0012B5F4D8|nr:hypothetical protein [Allorhizobium undicola]
MPRQLSYEEKILLRKLVGPDVPFISTLEAQMEDCLVESIFENGLKLTPKTNKRINVKQKIIGSGSLYDEDGIPIIIDLFQNEGLISELMIEKADSTPIRRVLDYSEVKALGFGQGITLEQ